MLRLLSLVSLWVAAAVAVAISPEASELIEARLASDGSIDDATLRAILDLENDQENRKLFMNWDWSNLLFHIGACTMSAETEAGCDAGTIHKCPPGPLHKCNCCPDCKLPHSHRISYCYARQSGGAESENGENGGDSGGSSGESSNERSGLGGNSQGATSRSNLFMYIAGAAVVASVIAGVLWRKRKRDQEDAADGNSMVGAVAKRMGLGGGGSDAFSIGASTLPESTGPDFIEIGDIDPAASTTVGAQGAEGIEIEGPIVPSSSYAI